MGSLTTSVSGSPASFLSPAEADIRSLKCYFEPVQAGTGDPSPDNVREISGWNAVNIYKEGKNLLDPTLITSSLYLNSSNITSSYKEWSLTDYIQVKENTTYTVSGSSITYNSPAA